MARFRKRLVPVSELVVRTGDGAALGRIPEILRQEMQYLWTRLEVHDGELPRSLAITSQLSGEGVSLTSLALAAVLARRGRTCLVEANWWTKGLEVDNDEDGLAGVLQGSTSLSSALTPTDHPGLTILPSGSLAVSGGSAVPYSDEISILMDSLHERFVYTVLDLPAISTSATALTYASAADASLLVVRQRGIRIDQVDVALNDLRNTRLLGIVLNDSKLSMPKFLQRRLLV